MELRIADIHTHILPGVDDGSPDMETSLQMIDIAYREGTRRLFLTPHYIPQRYTYDPASLPSRFAEIEQEARSRYPDLELYLGNEIYYSSGVLEDLRAGRIATMAGSRYVLVEFSPRDSFDRIYQAAREITNAGYRMILAHVERYRCLEKNADHLYRLMEMGVSLQTNATALIRGSSYSPSQVSRWNKKVLVSDWIRFLGTDAHDTTGRAPEISEAAAWIRRKNEPSAENILWENTQAILDDRMLPVI